MAKFSLRGDDDVEGSRRPNTKRQRFEISICRRQLQQRQEPVVTEDVEVLSESAEEVEEAREEDGEAEHHSEGDTEEEEEQEYEDDEQSIGYDHSARNVRVQQLRESCSQNTHRVRKNGGGAVATDHGDVDGYHAITLADPDVLDCPICLEPLSVPVFQCENGHIACSSCSTNVWNKCPSCALPIGYIRCRAMEKVIESVKISCQNCKYGCTEQASYCNKNDHEKTCTYAPCSCPQLHCNFIGSLNQLSAHFISKHPNTAKPFRFGWSFALTLEAQQKSFILQEQNGGQLFILNIKDFKPLGNVISLCCIQPITFKEEFSYSVVAKKDKCTVWLESVADNVVGLVEDPDQRRFLMVPQDFVDTCGRLKVEVTISNPHLHVLIFSQGRSR